jgi:hypothetical protein
LASLTWERGGQKARKARAGLSNLQVRAAYPPMQGLQFPGGVLSEELTGQPRQFWTGRKHPPCCHPSSLPASAPVGRHSTARHSATLSGPNAHSLTSSTHTRTPTHLQASRSIKVAVGHAVAVCDLGHHRPFPHHQVHIHERRQTPGCSLGSQGGAGVQLVREPAQAMA